MQKQAVSMSVYGVIIITCTSKGLCSELLKQSLQSASTFGVDFYAMVSMVEPHGPLHGKICPVQLHIAIRDAREQPS